MKNPILIQCNLVEYLIISTLNRYQKVSNLIGRKLSACKEKVRMVYPINTTDNRNQNLPGDNISKKINQPSTQTNSQNLRLQSISVQYYMNRHNLKIRNKGYLDK